MNPTEPNISDQDKTDDGLQTPEVLGTTPSKNIFRKINKKYLALIFLVIIAAGTFAYFQVFRNSKPTVTTTTKKLHPRYSLASAKPQYDSEVSVAGYIKYQPSKFELVDKVKPLPIKQTDPNVNSVVVQADLAGWGAGGLYLYDLQTNQVRKLTLDGGSPRIMSDHFVFYEYAQDHDTYREVGAKLLDLQTGQTETVFSGNTDEVPVSDCCSVSPDGFKAVYVTNNKISVWDIRTDETTTYPLTVKAVDEGSLNSIENEITYPAPAWIDNDSFMYADNPATKKVLRGSTLYSPATTANIYSFNTKTQQKTLVAKDQLGVYELYYRNGIGFEHRTTTDGLSQFAELSLIPSTEPKALPDEIEGFLELSPDGKQLFVFPTLTDYAFYKAIDTGDDTLKQFNPIPSGINVNQILPKGWAGPDRMIIEILDKSQPRHTYIAVYNTTANQIEQLQTIE